jgi:hypothetical protein
MKKIYILLTVSILLIGLSVSAHAVPVTLDNFSLKATSTSPEVLSQGDFSTFDKWYISDVSINSTYLLGGVPPTGGGFWVENSELFCSAAAILYQPSTNFASPLLPGTQYTFAYDVLAGSTFPLAIIGQNIGGATPIVEDSVYLPLDLGHNSVTFTTKGTIPDPSPGYGLDFAFAGGPVAVPEPATILLLGSGLIGLAGFARKKFKK